MYHYVRNIKNSKYPEIKGLEVEKFINQINYFKKNFRIITVDDLIDSIYSNKQMKDKSILLTFDDGYKDHFTYVNPILKKMEIQGLFFPPLKPIIENIVLDINKIHFILANVKDVKILIDKIFTFLKNNKTDDLLEPNEYFKKLAVPNRFDSGEVIFVKRILQRELPEKIREQLVNQLFNEYVEDNEKDFSLKLYLTLDEIKQMKENGMYFGAHTYSHYWLSHLSNNELDLELKNSITYYSKINNNKKNWLMCYPHGDYTNDIISILKKHGFKAAMTTKPGEAIVNFENCFKLNRFDTNDFPQ